MSNFNEVTLVGRIANDPEKTTVGDGISLTRFALAVNRIGKDKDVADFFNITTWRQTADTVAAYKQKGDLILVKGHLQQDKWQDKETGKNRTAISVVGDRVVFLPRAGQQQQTDAVGVGAGSNDTTETDIPF